MLLRFEVENHFSIKESQEISLIAGKLKGNESGLRRVAGASDLYAVPVALIYGANASGKTNFLLGLRFVREMVLFSHSKGKPDGGVPRIPFALVEQTEMMPSRFEVEFIVNGSRYIFGFTCDSHKFLAEWLYAFPEGKRRKLYERESKNVEFGPTMTGPKKQLANLMRQNSLFISTAAQNSHEEITKVASFFRDIDYISSASLPSIMISDRLVDGGHVDPRVINFLRTMGTGVVGLQQREREIEVPERLKALFEAAKARLGDEASAEMNFLQKEIEIELHHQGEGGNYPLPLRYESAGTLRLLRLTGKILHALDNGTLLLVDELDASLHTLVAEQIIELFTNPDYNLKGAQLIATTHDTNILSCDHLRRDQIWFCEKDDIGVSHIFSLADFKLRQSDRFEKGYLEGRFGAIPFAGDLKALIET